MLTEEQFDEAVRANMDTVYRVALNYLKNPSAAEDVCQEVFLRLFRRQPELQSPEHCRNWLIHVCINECKRALSTVRETEVPLDNLADVLPFSEPEDRMTWHLVMILPEKYRVVMYLHYYEGYSTGEIAKMLHRIPATVRSQLDRGRKQLKQMLLEAEHV